MVNPVLIVCAVIAVVAFFVGNIYVLVYFQHEDDKNQSYFPKFVVLTGLFLAEITVLMLPFDVAISGGGDADRENMEILWQFLYLSLAVFLVIIIPFTLFFYEGEDPEERNVRKQLCQAIQLEVCTIITVLLALLLMYFLLGIAEIPFWGYTTSFEANPSGAWSDISLACPDGAQCSGNKDTLQLAVTFPVYTMGLVSFVGWFFFVLFASIGLAALPMDLLSEYRFRPKKLPLDEYAREKTNLNKRASNLKELGKKLIASGKHKSTKAKHRKIYNGFRRDVYFLERDWEKLKEAAKGGGNPLVYWGYLLLSFVTAVFTILWLVHIILFMFLDPKDAQPFLNTMFVDLDNSFAFLGTVLYGAFAFFLIWVTIKGNMKFGLRFLFFTIHPMKLGATMMNSFLFNVGLILLCSVPVVQFCASAFALYAHDTAVENLFVIQVTNLKFMRYFFLNNVFLYALFGLFGLSFIYLLIFPSDSRKKKSDPRDDDDAWLAAR